MREERQAEAGLSHTRKPRSPRQFPDLRLCQTGFEQRSQNMMLPRRLLPGTKIAFIVGIDSISNGVKSVLSR